MSANERTRTEDDVNRLNRGGLSLLSSCYENRQRPDQPVVISPFSICSAFAMLWLGVKGKAKDQIGNGLGFTHGIDTLVKTWRRYQMSDNPKLLSSNSIWVDKRLPLKESYIETVRQHFPCSIFGFDNTRADESARQINERIESDTNGMIRDFIDPRSICPYRNKDDRGSSLFLINSFYFMGRWEDEFLQERTKTRYPFNCLDGTATQVEMMQDTKTVEYDEGGDYQVVSLPYLYERREGEWVDCAFVAVLPTPALDVNTLLRRLSAGTAFRDMMRRCTKREVKIKLPKFDIEFKTSLKSSLTKQGIVSPFAPSKETYSSMIADLDAVRKTYVNEVRHAVRIKMDEKKTEAAAVTSIEVACTSMGFFDPPQPVAEFTADHPFLGFIIERSSGLIILAAVIQGIGCGREPTMNRKELEKREKMRRQSFAAAMDEWRKNCQHPRRNSASGVVFIAALLLAAWVCLILWKFLME